MTFLIKSYNNGPQIDQSGRIWIDATRVNGSAPQPAHGASISNIYNLYYPSIQVTQPNAPSMPTFRVSDTSNVLGLPVLRFDGIDDGLTSDSLVFSLINMSFFVAGYFPNTVNFKQFFMEFGTDANLTPGFYLFGAGNPSFYVRRDLSGSFSQNGPINYPGNSFCVIALRVVQSSITLYQNNSQIGTIATPNGVSTVTNALNICYRNGGAGTIFTQGDVGELIFTNGGLSQNQFDYINTYLCRKWLGP